jgi:outer membrane protein assembly factor BamB
MKNAWMLIVLAAVVTQSVAAQSFESERLQNWHHWRGPNANGIAVNVNPPLEWSEETNVNWKVPIPGRGSATPIVWNDRVFVLTAVSTGDSGDEIPYQFTVLCLDRATGKPLWRKIATEQVPNEPGHKTNSYASASATTDGQYVYASFGSHGINCYDMDGNLKWERDLGDMQTRNEFGEGASSTVHGDTLIVPWDHEAGSFVVALDTATGNTRWKQDRDEPTTWATPLITVYDGRTQVVLHGTNRVRSYDLESGELIWECGGQSTNPIATPIRDGDLIYATTGHRGYGLFCIPLAATGDITGTDQVVWSRNDTGSYIATPVLHEGLLYVTKGRDGNECRECIRSMRHRSLPADESTISIATERPRCSSRVGS